MLHCHIRSILVVGLQTQCVVGQRHTCPSKAFPHTGGGAPLAVRLSPQAAAGEKWPALSLAACGLLADLTFSLVQPASCIPSTPHTHARIYPGCPLTTSGIFVGGIPTSGVARYR
jgi:hypothetical protein